MRTHIRLARGSPGPVEATSETDASVGEGRRRLRADATQLKVGDQVVDESRAAGHFAEETMGTRVGDDGAAHGWHEKGAHDDAVDEIEDFDDRVIWSPFRLQRRRRDRERLAARTS